MKCLFHCGPRPFNLCCISSTETLVNIWSVDSFLDKLSLVVVASCFARTPASPQKVVCVSCRESRVVIMSAKSNSDHLLVLANVPLCEDLEQTKTSLAENEKTLSADPMQLQRYSMDSMCLKRCLQTPIEGSMCSRYSGCFSLVGGIHLSSYR